jgi:putative endonuclease
LIQAVVLLLIPAMQVAAVRFIRVSSESVREHAALWLEHEQMYYVYLLHSAKDKGFYIGFSTNLKRRLAEHRRGASFATKSRGPWNLIYYEAYLNQEDALGREKYLKSGSGRRFLRAQLRHYLLQEPA